MESLCWSQEEFKGQYLVFGSLGTCEIRCDTALFLLGKGKMHLAVTGKNSFTPVFGG